MATRAPIPEPKNPPQTEPSSNIFYVGDRGFEADPDKMIVLQDEYRTGMECEQCFDKEHRIKRGGFAGQTESVVDCYNCNGTGKYLKNSLEIRCSICEGSGKITCPKCEGKGSPTIAIPDDQKGQVTCGTIVSIGGNINFYSLGDRVLYQSFAGHRFDLKGYDPVTKKTVERILVFHIERDMLGRVHGGQIEKNMVKKSMALHTAS